MSNGTMAEALAPLRTRMPATVREREILRVAALLPSLANGDVVETARREVVKWARKRSGGPLPKPAWEGESFEYLPGGRATFGVRIRTDEADLWALRCDDPDKTVAGRTWTTEVTIGRQGEDFARLGLRLLVSTPEETLDIHPSVPGLMRQLVNNCGAQALGGPPLGDTANWARSSADVDELVEFLEDPARSLPVIVASGDERGVAPEEPLIDVEALARTTVGLAHVVVLPAASTYALSDAFGKLRSVFHGAVRVFMPGFDASSNPYDHRLVLARDLQEAAELRIRELRELVAEDSLRRTRLGQDVLPFATLRTLGLRIEAEGRSQAGASDAEQMETARQRIVALEDELKAVEQERDQVFDLALHEEQRAKAAEAQLFGARARVEQLQGLLATRGQPSEKDALPATWAEFAEWCDQTLIGRVVLAPAARRSVKAPAFQDPVTAARCLLWLAGPCRERRMEGGGSLEELVEDGLWNRPCGADAFAFAFQGHSLTADWHVKNGGNTRDPGRCLRIYYGWDPATQQIVVAEMPAHRRTGAT